MKHIVIVGGGASGLVAAITAKTSNNKVTIVEKNAVCGKKILATGNGKCNFWNSDQALSHYHTEDAYLLPKIFTEENLQIASIFFAKLGVVSKVKNGYFYPFSNQASTIRNVLVEEALRKGVEIKNNFNVLELKKENAQFIIASETETLTADSLILATGSYAAPKTGSTGDGYKFLQAFGHSLIKPLPALVQLKTTGNFLKKWAGVRTDAKINLYVADSFMASSQGELQLTDYGISGICVFNLSRYVSRALEERKKVHVSINFIPYTDMDPYEYLKILLKDSSTKIRAQLERILNSKLVDTLLSVVKVDEEKSFKELPITEQTSLAFALANFELEVVGTKSFEEAQTVTGGIPLNQINPKTMESILIKNLYITGELLDIDGDCGGYNLSFAWISGYLAGKGSSND